MKKNLTTQTIAVFMVMSGFLSQVCAQEKVLLGWYFNAYDGNPALPAITSTVASRITDTGVEIATMTRGEGVGLQDFQRAYPVKLLDIENVEPTDESQNSKNTAFAKSACVEFVFKPKENYKASLTKLGFKLRAGSNGNNPVYYRWAISKDNWDTYCELGDSDGSVTYVSTSPSGFIQPDIDLTGVESLQNISNTEPIQFRLYFFGGRNSSNATIAIGQSENQTSSADVVLAVYGTTEPESTTPVALADFKAQKNKSGINLTWETFLEKENSHFEILRSSDNNVFATIGTISGNVNSNTRNQYSYLDMNPLQTVNYYKLKQVDLNGDFKEYGPVALAFNQENADGIRAYKSFDNVIVEINSSIKQRGTVKITDIQGSTVLSKDLYINHGMNKYEFDSNIIQGNEVYIISFGKHSYKLLIHE